jgi:ribosomal-protein-alanine N-acetyltransferase
MNALLQPGPHHRPMTVADLDAVLAIETVSYGFPWTRGNFIDSLAAGYRCELRLAPEGDILAYAVAMPAADEMHLLNITVRPALQGQGHAWALMQRLIAHGRQLGHRSLWLEVRPSNRRARALYEHLGFQAVGLRRGYYPDGPGRREDALVMSLAIAAGAPPHGLD